MATYNTAFGSLPGYNEQLGTTNTTGGGQQQTYDPQRQQRRQQQFAQQPQQTFAQMQRQGMARPAPAAPQAQPMARYAGSEQAGQMRQRLQQQLESFGNAPSRFDTQAFQQIRGAQAANLQAEYGAQQKALNEDLARRGLSASSIGGGRFGDLAGQQARALASLDAQLLQQAAETQAQDRAQLLAAGQGLAELAGAQDLQQFEANRVAQAAEFENQLRAAQFGQQQYEFGRGQAFQGAQAQQAAGQFGQELGLRLGELTGQIGGQQTLAGQQQAEQRRQFDIQQALQAQLGLGNLSLEQQRIVNQANQFGLQLNEQQAARIQQGGFTAQELALEARKAENQVDQFGRQLSAQERQNAALNALEARKLEEDVNFRSQQLGLNRDELNQRAAQIKEDQRLRGVELTNEQAFREAELGLRTTQVQNEFTRSGQQISVEQARIQAQKDIANAENASQMARLDRQLASQAALQTQELESRAGESALERELRQTLQATDIMAQLETLGRQQTFQAGESDLERQARSALQGQQLKEQGRQFNLEQSLRQALAMSEATGYFYQPLTTGAEVGALGGIKETMARQAEAARQTQASLDFQLRRALGLAETTGYVYDMSGRQQAQQTVQSRLATAQQQLAENDFLMRLIGTMGTSEMGKGIQEFLQNRQTSGGASGGGGGGGGTGEQGQGDGNSTFIPGDLTGIYQSGSANEAMPLDSYPSSSFSAAPDIVSQLSSILGGSTRTTTTQPTQQNNLLAYLSSILGGATNLQGALSNASTTAARTSTTPTSTFGATGQTGATGTTNPQATWESIANSTWSGAANQGLSRDQLEFGIRQNQSLNAYRQRLAALPADQRAKYVPVESLPMMFYKGQSVPEEAQPGGVINNYTVGPDGTVAGNTFLGYDGTGFLPLTKRVQPLPGGGLGNFYYTASGQRWA